MTKQPVISRLILIALLLALTACTKGVGSISGTVIDEHGEPVSGAMVQVAGQSVITDENGKYSVAEAPAGKHQVAASKSGVGALTTECTVQKGTAITCDLVLVAQD